MPYADPEEKKRYMKAWWAENKAHTQSYRERTKEHRSKTHAAWGLKNKERRNASMRKWRESPDNRFSSNVRSRICNALRGRTKISDTFSLVGCSTAQLKLWLTQFFQPGMSWENYGSWEVDHIRPCASFDLSDPAQQRECFHYLNLQPLWMPKNRQKGCRV